MRRSRVARITLVCVCVCVCVASVCDLSCFGVLVSIVLLIAWGTAVVADAALMSVPNYAHVAWVIAGKAHASWEYNDEDLACVSARFLRIRSW